MNSLIFKSFNKIDSIPKWFLENHPNLFALFLMIFMPIITLLAVFLSGMVVIIPISLLFGWL